LRLFVLGFTPFPYDISAEAVEYSYSHIAADADMAAHHWDDGVPWPEALAGTEYHPNIMADWQYRRENTPPGHLVYCAVTPINLARSGLAPCKASEGDMVLPPPWDTHGFDHADVKAAFLNYCVQVIEYFSPDYFCMGIEVNLLMKNVPAKWPAYLELHRYVYGRLKSVYPELPVMVSLTGMDLVEGYTDAVHDDQTQVMRDIEPFSDWFGVSLHPFMSVYLADSIPDDLCASVFSLSDKPVFVCETSYPAETFSINGGSLMFNGSETKQDRYFEQLFSEAHARGIRGIVNFVIRDYDALWRAIGSPDDVNKLWRDTGLYDENGKPRPARDRWVQQLRRGRGS
jgi:hypothetical protein